MWSERLARLETGEYARAALPFAALLLRSLHIGCLRYCKAGVAFIKSHAGVYPPTNGLYHCPALKPGFLVPFCYLGLHGLGENRLEGLMGWSSSG